MNPEAKKISTSSETLFTIDLLKGRGIPVKRGPAGIVITAVTAIVPVVLVIMIFGFRSQDKVLMSLKKQEIESLEQKINRLSGDVEDQKVLEQEKIQASQCISEVNSLIKKYTPWSPILTTIIENMPGSVVLTGLNVKLDSVEKEVPKPDEPQKKIKINVPVNKLSLTVSDQGQGNCDEAVRDFQDRLRSSPVLGPLLAKIDVSHKTDNLEGKAVVSYTIDCLFKPD